MEINEARQLAGESVQYIGARYVPKFYTNSVDPDSIEWEADVAYEPITVVSYMGDSYTSKIPVPATVGNPADNPHYWARTGQFNAAIAALQEEMQAVKLRVTDLETQCGNETLETNAQTLSGGINELKEQIGNETLETTSQILTGAINEVNAKLVNVDGIPNSLLSPIKYGAVVDANANGNAQGSCMIDEDTAVQWFDVSGGGTIRIINIKTGVYTDYPTNIVSHGNSLAYNGEVVAMIGTISGGGNNTTIYTFSPEDPTNITAHELVNILPSMMNNRVIMITWDKDNNSWIVCGAGDINNGWPFLWISADFTQYTKNITVKDPYLGYNNVYQDICYDGTHLYFLVISPASLITIDPNNGNVISVSKIDEVYNDDMKISEFESIDYIDGVIMITAKSTLPSYTTKVHSYGYLCPKGNRRENPTLAIKNYYVNGVGSYGANGTSAKPFATLHEALLCNHGNRRIVNVSGTLTEPLYISNDDVIVSGGTVQGVYCYQSTVRLVNVTSVAMITSGSIKAYIIFEGSDGKTLSCTCGAISEANEYYVAAINGSDLKSNNFPNQNVIYHDYTSWIGSMHGIIGWRNEGTATPSITVKMPQAYTNGGMMGALLIIDNIAVPFRFSYNSATVELDSSSGITATKSANSWDITFTKTDEDIPAWCQFGIVPTY